MSETVRPRTEVERELARIWERVLERAPIGMHEDFFDLGGSSVQAARIFAGIEETFHRRLPLSVILGAPTIEQLAVSLLPGKARDRKACVVPIQPGGEKPILFCVGGGATWRPVAEHLGADQPVCSVELEPGALQQMKGPKPMEKLARHMVSAVREKQPEGPYYLSGYCQDGLFAYEVARQLTMYGHEVRLLALVETRNPYPHLRVRVKTGLRRNAMRLSFQADQLRELLRTGGLTEYVRARRLQLKRFRLRISSRLSPRLRERARQTAREDLGGFLYLESSFSRPKPLACPVAIFRCTHWQILSAGDPYFGWRDLLTGRTEIHEIPGDHEGMFREPNVRVLAEKLRGSLQNVRQSEAPSSYEMIADVVRTQ